MRNDWSPGDIVMLTAAVRELHRQNPGAFLTDVRTACPALWENNPHITPLRRTGHGVEVLDCEYPLINKSNFRPVHCLNGFAEFLAERLGVSCSISEFRGDIHLSPAEVAAPSPIQQALGSDVPYWLIVAGGKLDYTIKWWETARYQAVVDHFAERLLFVQVGLRTHHHPPLTGILDLRGRTSLRRLVRWVYHAEGVVCPVTGLMHMAAAVPRPPGKLRLRPCVVIAGGREPPHWEAYPGHQFIHTVGQLACCTTGGCWRSRTFALGDGDEQDRPERICVDVAGNLPRCMDVIRSEDVIQRIEMYLRSGAAALLKDRDVQVVRSKLKRWSIEGSDPRFH